MLLTPQTERAIHETLERAMDEYSRYLTGTSLGDQFPTNTTRIPTRPLAALERAYLMGKLAHAVGPEDLAKMPPQFAEDLLDATQIPLTDRDQATLDLYKSQTRRSIEDALSRWKAALRATANEAERNWTSLLLAGGVTAAAMGLARRKEQASLERGIGSLLLGFLMGTDTLVQTAENDYYQRGAASMAQLDDKVFKVPRDTACKHCKRLHLNPNGTPKKYRLRDIQGNSNEGRPASAWAFTIGSTHSHCYCTLHFEPATRGQ